MSNFGYLADEPVSPTSHEIAGGITMQQYAAIHLKVPNSGLDWLDDMIRQSLRDDFAAKAMKSLLATITEYPDEKWREGLAIDVYMMADAMLSARDGTK